MNRISKFLVAVCAVTALFVAGGGVGPMSAKTINGCAIKVKTDCKSAKLKGANLNKANLKGANLNKANLKGATLDGVLGPVEGTPLLPSEWTLLNRYFIGPNANLNQANLFGDDLSGAKMSGADLKGADLTGANLINANLTGTDLTGTDLTGVISYSVVGTPFLPEGWALLDGYLVGVFF